MSKSRGGLGRGLAALIPTGPQTNTVTEVLMGGPIRPLVAVPSNPPTREGHEGTGQSNDAEAPNDRAAHATATPPTLTADAEGPRYAEIPVTAIRPNPRNPRSAFDQDALDELAHSIREFGLLQPVVVRPVDDGYELVMGERRWRAARQAGVEVVAAIVRRTEDAEMLRDALLENIHRTNLNPLEEAAAYQQLLEEFDVTQEELATRLGRSRPVISNTIRLLNLPLAVQRRVAAGVLSAGHARALLSLSDPGDQEDLAARIVAEGLSVRGAEEAVTLLARRKPAVRRTPVRKMTMPGVTELATNLSDAFDTRVLVELGRRKGRIVVEFATVDDLERLVGIMAPAVANRRRGENGSTAASVTPAPSASASPVAPSVVETVNFDADLADPAYLGELYEVTATRFAQPPVSDRGGAIENDAPETAFRREHETETSTAAGPTDEPDAAEADGSDDETASVGRDSYSVAEVDSKEPEAVSAVL
jgi:ParB family chromosome partitioning protein